MDWTDGPGTVSAVVAVLALIGTFVGFLLTLRKSGDAAASAASAHRSETRANEARDRAADALVRANELAEVATVREDEDWFVEWRAKWDSHTSVLTLTNWGKDPARAPSATITAEDLHRVVGPGADVAPQAALEIELPEIRERRHRYGSESDAAVRDMQAAGIFYAPASFFTDIKVVVRWRTGQGRIQEQVIGERIG
jgi:hypothetical protein